MNEYEHLKKQKEGMLAKHREPGTRCPFGCPHESEKQLKVRYDAAVKVVEAARPIVAERPEAQMSINIRNLASALREYDQAEKEGYEKPRSV